MIQTQTPEQTAAAAAEAARLENNSARILAIQERIVRARQLEARYAQDTSAEGQEAYRRAQQLLVNLERRRKHEQAGLVDQKTFNKEFSSFAKSYTKLSSSVKSQLQTQSSVNSQTSIYKALGEDIAKSKAREANLSGDALDREQERGSFMAEINSSLLTQAKATAKAIDDAEGLTEFDKMRRELKETALSLSDEERKKLEDAINSTEKLYQKEQRILAIKEQQKGLYEAVPESMRSGLDFAQKLGDTLQNAGPQAAAFMLLAAALTAAVASFTALDTAAKEFRTETGLTNSQTKEIKSNVNEIVGEYGNLGVEAKNVFDTVSALKKEFGDVYDVSKETTAALTVLSTNFGIATEDAAKVQGVYERMGGLSSETAANVQMQAAEMAKMAGVAPAKVAQDIAEAAEESYKFFKGDIVALNAAAIQARRLGTNLKDVLEVNRKLLDFEGTIEDELVAATFANGQFNLTQARTLAASGKQVEAQEEILRQIQRSGDFRKQDLFTQEALAKGAGMEVGEIIKQLDTQEKLSKLSSEERAAAQEAINQGLDITDIKAEELALETAKFATQKEQQGVVENLQNQFTSLAATVGTSLVPLLESIIPIMDLILLPVQAVATGFSMIVGFLKENIPLMILLGSLATAYYAKSIGAAIAQIWGKIVGFLGPFGIPVAIMATLGAVSMARNAMSAAKAGDVMSPADGKTRISTKEGGLFELSPNDDLVAAPGAADALANSNSEKEGGLFSRVFGKDKEDGEGLPPTINVDFTALSAPLNAMINEIKALRADMASGKIAVYMDTAKVTSNIGKQVDQTTRNNYSLGQA